jgi:drug/metabolite transporter (DMT)-like permease
MLWALFTVIAAGSQTLRNALQRDLTAKLGVVGATHVRFLFGFPFSLLFLGLMVLVTGEAVPEIRLSIFPAVLVAALTQIGATGLMLAAMRSKSFVTTIAYTKTEPVLVAIFGLVFLGDKLSPAMASAIGIATIGVLLTAWPRDRAQSWSLPAIALGLTSAALFAISAIAFRAAIHALPSGGFGIRASTILVLGLFCQSFLLSGWLALTNREALKAIMRLWKPSLFAGFMGALASQFWFLGFALATAAQVRTLALIEVIFARVISGKLFSEAPSAREGLGLVLIVVGVAILINSSSF